MSAKFRLILGVIIILTFFSLAAIYQSYQKVGETVTLQNHQVYLEGKYPSLEHLSTHSLAVMLKDRDAGGQNFLLVDCRGLDEFKFSHIPGAVHLQTAEEVGAYLEKESLSPGSIPIYCAVGSRSARLAEILRERGFQNVRYVAGSIFAWANEDRPLVDASGKAAFQVHPYTPFWRRLLEDGKAAPFDFSK